MNDSLLLSEVGRVRTWNIRTLYTLKEDRGLKGFRTQGLAGGWGGVGGGGKAWVGHCCVEGVLGQLENDGQALDAWESQGEEGI